MNINKLIVDTLKPLNIPVSFQTYNGDSQLYITFFEYLTQSEKHADNKEKNIGHYIQVDIWSKEDYSMTVENVLSAMKAADFKRTTSTDLYESNTQIYHKAIRFLYLEYLI